MRVYGAWGWGSVVLGFDGDVFSAVVSDPAYMLSMAVLWKGGIDLFLKGSPKKKKMFSCLWQRTKNLFQVVEIASLGDLTSLSPQGAIGTT